VDLISGPMNLFHKLVILSVDGSRIDSIQCWPRHGAPGTVRW
jgi:hypothetical protein